MAAFELLENGQHKKKHTFKAEFQQKEDVIPEPKAVTGELFHF